MAARDCRLLADLLPSILAVIDQPADDPSQIGFPMGQLVGAASNAQEECFRLASQLDADITIKETIISVASNVGYVVLPADCRGVRTTTVWNVSAGSAGRPLACGDWSQRGKREYDAIFKAKDADHGNQATLIFMRPTPTPYSVLLEYEYFPIRLAHGCLPGDAGAQHLQLADYEPAESTLLAGQTFYITADPFGTAADQNHPAASWTGSTRTANFLVADIWNPIPKKGATYTTRPDLHRDWEQFFIFQTAAFLGKKLPPRIVTAWEAERARLEIRAKHQGITLDRRAAKIVKPASAGRGLQGDPINRPWRW